MIRKTDVVIVGAGPAGLACAIKCNDLGIDFLLIEKSNRVGGRIGSIKENGYIFDLGFQVYNTAYHFTNSIIDEDLELKTFKPGASIYYGGIFEIVSDPTRDFRYLFKTIFSKVGTISDKLKILRLKFSLSDYSIEKDFSNDVPTLNYLRGYGFSDTIIKNFFRPFFSGIFLEKDLETSSKFFKYVFSKLNIGLAALPIEGMQSLPDKMFRKLDSCNVLFNKKVEKINSNKKIVLNNGQIINGNKIILTGESIKLISSTSIKYNSIKTIYFSSMIKPENGQYIHLFPDDDIINNIAILTMVSKEYSQNSDHLFSISILSDNKSELEYITYVHNKLTEFYGGGKSDYQFLKYMDIKKATISQLPDFFKNQYFKKDGIILAGDQTVNGSIDGAVFSGIRAIDFLHKDKLNKI